jgi:pyruvate dehydrogenase E1 component beta subunit
MLANKFLNYTLLYIQAIDHIINSAAKSNYMSAGQIYVPIVLRGPNGATAGVDAQHS